MRTKLVTTRIDNSKTLEQFMPDGEGDAFVFTEIMMRGMLVKTFYHRSRQEFRSHTTPMRVLCHSLGAVAHTYLGLRSFQNVGKVFAAAVCETTLQGEWSNLPKLYDNTCRRTKPLTTYWTITNLDKEHAVDAEQLEGWLRHGKHLLASVRSKKATHFVVTPHPIQLKVKNGFSLDRHGMVPLFEF